MKYRYVVLSMVALLIALTLSGCADLFGTSPTAMAKDLISKLFTAPATELVYVKPATDTGLINVADGIVDVLREIMTYAHTATPTLNVKAVTDYSSDAKWLPYLITGKPDFVDKVYMVEIVASTSATSICVTWPMITVKGVANKGFFFAVYYEGATPTFYPLWLGFGV